MPGFYLLTNITVLSYFYHIIATCLCVIQTWIDYFLNVFQLQNTNYFSK